MKLLIHAHAYPDFLRGFYAVHPGLATLGYQEQFAALDREAHVGANAAWAEALAPLGYEVMVTVANNAPLQKAWAKEQGVRYRPAAWQDDIALAQTVAFQPDLLFFTSYSAFRPAWIRQLRDTVPSVRLTGVWCGMPFRSFEPFRSFDLVLTCIPESQARFSAAGCTSRHLHHGFDPRVLRPLDGTREPDIPFSFIGQLIRAGGYHEDRVQELVALAAALDIAIFSPAHDFYRWQVVREPLRVAAYHLARSLHRWGVPRKVLDRLPQLREALQRTTSPPPIASERLRPRTRPAVFGLEMYRTLQRSRLTYNNHGEISSDSASNRRLFEATGVGTCLLTDHKENLVTLFEPDREVVTFASTAECIEKARWLLNHPRECREIGLAGQRRTLAEHTYRQRAQQLDAIIRELFLGGKRGAGLP